MSMLPEKRNQQAYLPISDDEPSRSSSSELDAMLYNGSTSISARRYPRILRSLMIGFAVAVYSVLLVTLTSVWCKKERLHGAGVIDTPLRSAIHYESKFFKDTQWSTDYNLVGPPSDELDARWSEVMNTFFTEIPYEYMENLDRLHEGIRLPNGNYLAVYAVMHQLHCLKRLYQSYFEDRYFPNMTNEEKEMMKEHNLHCLQMLLEGITCKADEAPLTAQFSDNSILITGNRDIAHECVDWNLLVEELRRKRVNPFEPGLLEHPIFGPLPDGKKIPFPDRIGYGPKGKALGNTGLF